MIHDESIEEANDELDSDVNSEQGLIEYYGTKELRWYQIAARNETIDHLELGLRRICIKLPTGSGKTIALAASLNNDRFKKTIGIQTEKLRVLFVSHVHRILNQAEQVFATENQVEFMPQSMFSQVSPEYIKRGWDLVVLDECHHESCLTFQYHLETLGNFPIIGLTATPERADGLLIKFDRIVEPISREQAVREGWLAETELYSFVDAPERSKLDILRDIFNSKYAQNINGTMVFVRTKEEVAVLTDFLKQQGRRAVAILDQSGKKVSDLLDRFSQKEVDILVNCYRVGEGVDVKGCETVVLGRTFGSYPQLNQVIGRASRPDSICRVIELINPLSGRNLDTTVVTGTPKVHKLIYRQNKQWIETEFDYTSDWSTEGELGTKDDVMR